MEPLIQISFEYRVSKEFCDVFESYIGITDKSMDRDFLQSLSNKEKFQQIYNDFDEAFAVGLIFKLIVDQNIELFQQIYLGCENNGNECQNYALQLLRYTIFQLGKKDPQTYLNNILANKDVPLQPLGGGTNLSKIYSFVHLCQLGQLFKQFQSLIKYKFWQGYYFENVDIEEAELYFFQPKKLLPILVLIKDDKTTIQKKVLQNHQIFLQNIAIQISIDAAARSLSKISESLCYQPFRCNSIEELARILFDGSPNKQDKIYKFKSIPLIEQIFHFLIDNRTHFEWYYQKLIEHQDIQQKQTFDAFKTLPPPPLTAQQLKRMAQVHKL